MSDVPSEVSDQVVPKSGISHKIYLFLLIVLLILCAWYIYTRVSTEKTVEPDVFVKPKYQYNTDVVFYMSKECGYCTMQLETLNNCGMIDNITVIDTGFEDNSEEHKEKIKELSGYPAFVYNDTIVYGFHADLDDLGKKLFDKTE